MLIPASETKRGDTKPVYERQISAPSLGQYNKISIAREESHSIFGAEASSPEQRRTKSTICYSTAPLSSHYLSVHRARAIKMSRYLRSLSFKRHWGKKGGNPELFIFFAALAMFITQ